jgi:hypothetical protein
MPRTVELEARRPPRGLGWLPGVRLPGVRLSDIGLPGRCIQGRCMGRQGALGVLAPVIAAPMPATHLTQPV